MGTTYLLFDESSVAKSFSDTCKRHARDLAAGGSSIEEVMVLLRLCHNYAASALRVTRNDNLDSCARLLKQSFIILQGERMKRENGEKDL